MSVHRVWELAKEKFNIQGGTIHQIAKDYFKLPGTDYLIDLFMQNGCDCKVMIRLDGETRWTIATFLSYDNIYKDKLGNWWLSGSAFIPGFNSGGYLTGLKVGETLKAVNLTDSDG